MVFGIYSLVRLIILLNSEDKAYYSKEQYLIGFTSAVTMIIGSENFMVFWVTLVCRYFGFVGMGVWVNPKEYAPGTHDLYEHRHYLPKHSQNIVVRIPYSQCRLAVEGPFLQLFVDYCDQLQFLRVTDRLRFGDHRGGCPE
jgi:hypothetical protein